MFRDLNEKEIKEFQDGVYEDETINNFIRYFSLIHPVAKEEVIKRLKNYKEEPK